MLKRIFYLGVGVLLLSCSHSENYDIVIQNGRIVDGSGSPSFLADIAINSDTIAFIGQLKYFKAKKVIDANRMNITPGFINMLSWATTSLIEDGRSQSDIRQGVTLEVFGEGESSGPITKEAKEDMLKSQGDIKYDIPWNTLGEYLQYLEDKGVSTNVASFIGATTLRTNVIGYENREPSKDELNQMKQMVHVAMKEGALGIGSSLIYTPAFYAKTEELIELCKVAAEYDGMYISHLRSESNNILESLDELIRISKEANIRAEVYHLKQAGQKNWNKLDDVIKKIESARADGLEITADMYNYIAGSTGLDASMPPWVQEGGYDKWAERLKNPKIRKKLLKEMKEDALTWESLMQAAGSAKNILLIGFKNKALRSYIGKTLADVAKLRDKSAEETAMDLVIEDGSRVEAVYFLMSEENIKRQMALDWMSFCSDAGSYTNEGVFLNFSTHPRAYGNFSRLLGKYVRDEKVMSLEEAIYKLTSFPASNLKIKKRGLLKVAYFADINVFNLDSIQDHATFDKPHQYSTGMLHVFVNGGHVLNNGKHSNIKSGRFVRGPGYQKK